MQAPKTSRTLSESGAPKRIKSYVVLSSHLEAQPQPRQSAKDSEEVSPLPVRGKENDQPYRAKCQMQSKLVDSVTVPLRSNPLNTEKDKQDPKSSVNSYAGIARIMDSKD
jgi:hypothetical protein